jgi:hypothetical protein
MIEPNENRVVIIGHPESGKTHIADELAIQYPDYKVYRTDDYILHGFERSLYVLLGDIERDAAPKVIVEGVQGYRLLRKGAELGTFDADLVIVAGRPPVRNPRAVEHFGKALDKVFNDYMSMKRNEPRIVRL